MPETGKSGFPVASWRKGPEFLEPLEKLRGLPSVQLLVSYLKEVASSRVMVNVIEVRCVKNFFFG